MNWRALLDLVVWRLYGDEPDTCASMRRLFNASSTLRVIHASPRWSRFVLLTDAKGRSLVRSTFAKLRRTA